MTLALPAAAQEASRPTAVERFDLAGLAGQWYEVANTGAWPHRRCLGNTRFTIDRPDGRAAAVVRSCTGRDGAELRRGRVRAPRDGSGALGVHFAPGIFGWLPPVWSDHWVLAVGAEQRWVLLGDRRRRQLAIWARVVSLDEASLAEAIGAARRQGFDIEGLTPVPHSAAAIEPAIE
jgi:lipocalin